MSQRSQNHQNSTKPCWFYNTSRGCKHGSNCRFAHDINQHSIYGGMVQAIFGIIERKLNETSKRVHFNEQKEPEKESLRSLLQTANEKIEKLEKRIAKDNETYNKLFKSNMALQKSYGISQEKVKYSQEQISSMSKDMATTWGEARDREIENRKLKEELKEKEELKRAGDLNKHMAEVKKEIKKMNNDLNNMAKEQQNLHKLSEKLETLDLKKMMTNLNTNIGDKHKELLKNIKLVNSTMNSFENHPNLKSEIVDRIDLLESILMDHMDSKHKTLLDIMTQENELKTQTTQTDKLDDDNALNINVNEEDGYDKEISHHSDIKEEYSDDDEAHRSDCDDVQSEDIETDKATKKSKSWFSEELMRQYPHFRKMNVFE